MDTLKPYAMGRYTIAGCDEGFFDVTYESLFVPVFPSSSAFAEGRSLGLASCA